MEQCRYRVHGRVLVPGTAFFEIAAVAAVALLPASQPLLTALAIRSPKILTAADTTASLLCRVQTSGILEISSPGNTIAHVTASLLSPQQASRLNHVAALVPRVEHALQKPAQQSGAIAKLAGLHLPTAVGAEAYPAHPAPADAALHLGALLGRPGVPPGVPVAAGAVIAGGGSSHISHASGGWAVAGALQSPVFHALKLCNAAARSVTVILSAIIVLGWEGARQ